MGQSRYIEAEAADVIPLVGMRMLVDSHNLSVDVEDGGRIVIQAKN